jgi:plasmid stability protein
MATLTIRDVPEEHIVTLKERARRNRRSMQAELLIILDTILLTREEALQVIERTWEEQARPTTPDEIEAWIRESRP